MWTKSRSLVLTKIIILLFALALVLGCLYLPALLDRYLTAFGRDRTDAYSPLLFTLYTASVPAGALLFCLYRLLGHMEQGNIFSAENILLLRIISWCCFAAAAIFSVFCFRYTLALMIAVAAGFMGLIVRVVKNAFEQAQILKDENDFTI